MITIQSLPESRWQEYRDLRLEALSCDFVAFGSSYEEENNFSEEEWKRRVKNALFAVSNNKPIGVIVCIQEEKSRTKHVANIYSVYVSPQFREQGVGKQLMSAILNKINKNQTIVKVKLMVNPLQKAAVHLYQSHGFEIVGTLRKEMYVNGKFYDELIMEKLVG